MKITGWTEFGDPKYEEMYPIGENTDRPWSEIEDVERLIAEELRNRGYRFTGSYHQEGDYGVPIIDNRWRFECSCRTWGAIMLMAYPESIDNSDGLGYTEWAWLPPTDEVVPKGDDYGN